MIFREVLMSALFGVFHYSGRSDRLEHWTFAFLTAVVVIGLVLANRLFGVIYTGSLFLAVVFVGLWFLLAHIALFVRRLHDQGRSGLFMLIPLVAVTIFLTGWLGQGGYISYQTAFFREYGWIIQTVGRSLMIISAGMLLTVFIGEGDPGPNDYGEPVI